MMKQLWTMMLQILLKYCQHILRLQQLPSHRMPEIDIYKKNAFVMRSSFNTSTIESCIINNNDSNCFPEKVTALFHHINIPQLWTIWSNSVSSLSLNHFPLKTSSIIKARMNHKCHTTTHPTLPLFTNWENYCTDVPRKVVQMFMLV